MYLIYHTRFDNGSESHEVRVHQMFMNEDGWPVTAPYEYSGDKISEKGYDKDEIVGSYEFINHGIVYSSAMSKTLKVNLNKDNTITGDVQGKWSMMDGKPLMSMDIEGITYKGVFFKQNDESKFDLKVMTFSAVGNNNQCIWGSKEVNDDTAVKLVLYDLENKIPSSTKSNIKLPLQGKYETKITWASGDKAIIDDTGVVNQPAKDTEVILTAKIIKGKTETKKTIKVLVKGR
jgi:arabinan endo-1,5-alpha-L-arabinosidase